MTAFNYDFIKSRKREKMYEKLSKNALLNMYFGTITGTIAILAIIFVPVSYTHLDAADD